MNGYTYYTIKSGDTLYKIAKAFGIQIERILMANPGIVPNNLKVSQIIVVPTGNVVNTKVDYSYNSMILDINSLVRIYPFLQISSIGYSVLGKYIPLIKLGNGKKHIFYNGSFHANEWITSVLLMKFIEDYSLAYTINSNIYGYNIRDLFNNVSLYIAPMVNPDGVDLVTNNIDKNSISYENAINIANNYPNIPFPNGWKANIEGVDLNLQFPARLGKSKTDKIFSRFYLSCSTRFRGLWSINCTRSTSCI